LYVIAEALAYYINKDSEWLSASAVATPGLSANHKLASEEPEKYIAMACDDTWVLTPRLEEWNYYDKLRWMGFVMPWTYLWVTYDEEIKTMQDFVGKRVNIKRKGALDVPFCEEVLKRAGIFDKVAALEYAGFGGNKSNLKDGLVDVALTMPNHILPAAFSKGSYIEDLETRGPIYYVSWSADIVKEVAELPFSENLGFSLTTIFPGALDANTQPEAINAALMTAFIGVDERMPDDVVLEVTRILWERAGQFGVWHPMGHNLTRELLATYYRWPELVHPGFAEFVEEQGAELRNVVELFP